MGERGNGKSSWNGAEKYPDKDITKSMFAKAMEVGVVAVMSNNVYTFGGEIRLQREGGAIGVKMTGDLAKGVMVPWDVQFTEKLKRLLI